MITGNDDLDKQLAWCSSWDLPDIPSIDSLPGFAMPQLAQQGFSSQTSLSGSYYMDCYSSGGMHYATPGSEKASNMISSSGPPSKRRPSWPLAGTGQIVRQTSERRASAVPSMQTTEPVCKSESHSRSNLTLRLENGGSDNSQPMLSALASPIGTYYKKSTNSIVPESRTCRTPTAQCETQSSLGQTTFLPARKYEEGTSGMAQAISDYLMCCKDSKCEQPECTAEGMEPCLPEDLARCMPFTCIPLKRHSFEDWRTPGSVPPSSNALQNFSCLTPPSDHSPERPSSVCDLPVSLDCCPSLAPHLLSTPASAYNCPSQSYLQDCHPGFQNQQEHIAIMQPVKTLADDSAPLNPPMPAMCDMSSLDQSRQPSSSLGHYSNDDYGHLQQPNRPRSCSGSYPVGSQPNFCVSLAHPDSQTAPPWYTPFATQQYGPKCSASTICCEMQADRSYPCFSPPTSEELSQDIIESELEKALSSFNVHSCRRKSSITYVEADITLNEVELTKKRMSRSSAKVQP